VVLKVGRDNPREKDRINAVNLKLKGIDGRAGLRVDVDGCPDLVRDFAEVALRPDGAGVLKIRDRGDPYHERTHASDGVGYLIGREWPTVDEAHRAMTKPKPRPPRQYGRLLGELRW
jgi:hypothetical protein